MTTIDTLLDTYCADPAHAHHVASHAIDLFDGLAARLELPRSARRLLEAAALLHNVGMATDPERHHTVGRDIVLTAPPTGLQGEQLALVACLVAFHRKKVRPDLEPAFVRLSAANQRLALKLAALLRVADGLDYSETQTSRIVALEHQNDCVRLTVHGPHAATECQRAERKADIWRKATGLGLELVAEDRTTAGGEDRTTVGVRDDGPDTVVRSARLPAPEQAHTAAQAPPPLLTPDMPLAELARHVLLGAFQGVLAGEVAVRGGKDPEAVHDMRVAIRRLRSGLQIFAPAFEPKMVRTFRRGLRRVADDLGVVRDREVFLASLAGFARTDGNGTAAGLAPLEKQLDQERLAAREDLLAAFASDRYRRLKRELATFLTTPGMAVHYPDDDTHDIMPTRTRDMVGSAIWARYEALRAYEPALPEAPAPVLHQCRITGKRLRYTLELLKPVLGPRTRDVLAPLVALQDLLGTIQDVEVARERIAALPAHPALEAYGAARDAQLQAAQQALPAAIQRVFQSTYRRKLMELIVRL